LSSQVLASGAYSAYNLCMQYTIRNVPEYLDAALRGSAREQGKSLNEVAVLALVRGAGLSPEPRRWRELGDIAGSWQDDPAFDSALASQDTVDESLWP
jgi:plasmid stability protein